MDRPNAAVELSASFPTDAEALDRSRQLVHAAGDLLAEDGLEGLTVRAVLKRSGLARRAFYERFAGKDDLVLAVFEQILREAAAMYRAQSGQLATPLAKIEMIVMGLVRGADDGDTRSRNLATAMVREHLRLAQTRPRQLQAALQPLLDFIAELVTEGIRAGQLRSCDPVLQASLIYNLVATTLHTRLMAKDTITGPELPGDELARGIWEFCRGAIIA